MQDNNSTEEYLRVTEILYKFSDLYLVPPDVLANAARRGTEVHNICEGIALGFGELGVTDETRPYVESFKHWWGEGKKAIEIERRFWCPDIKVTGQADFIIQEETGNTIYDLKTSYKPSKTWQAQGSGYYYLASKAGLQISRVIFVHLQRSGRPAKLIEYPADSTLFLETYHVYKHFYG